MATWLGTNATKVAASPAKLAEEGEQTGRLRVLYDEFALTADMGVNDIIKIGAPLPANARVMNALLDSPDLDSSSAGALTLGWAASADGVESADAAGFLTTQDVHTAGIAGQMSSLLCSNVAGKFKRFAASVQVQVKVTGETDATSGTIRVAIFYVVD